MRWNPPFSQLYILFKGVLSMKKHTPLFTKVPFLQISYQSISCASGTRPFSQRFCCAFFSHINTKPEHLCKFRFFYIKMPMNSQGLCYQPLSQTYWDKQKIIYINICICIFQFSKWRKTVLPFSVCTFLSPPNTHVFHAKHLLSSVHGDHPFFTKAPPKEFHSIKDRHFYKGCSPSIGSVSGTFFYQEKKNKENNKANQNMKDKEQKGKKGNTLKQMEKKEKKGQEKKTEITEKKSKKIAKQTKNEKARKERKKIKRKNTQKKGRSKPKKIKKETNRKTKKKTKYIKHAKRKNIDKR